MNTPGLSRRHFLTSSATAATGMAAGSLLQATTSLAAETPKLKQGDVILFQGDSITDARRDKKRQDTPNDAAAMGLGYPQHVAGGLLAENSKLGLKIYNRGISGHKVPQLDERWQADTLDLKPAILSILIGVNDIWHKLGGRYDGTAETYREGYAALLAKTREALPDVVLVVCEPFVLKTGAVNDDWFPDFDAYRENALKVAAEAGAIVVPFQKMFDEAVASGTEPGYWAADGVHPTIAGHALMAKTWRETVGI